MRYKVLFLFFLYLFTTCSCNLDIEYNPIEGSISVPSDYNIYNVYIYCNQRQRDTVSYYIVLKDLDNGRSKINMKNDYTNYFKQIKNICEGDSGIIFVSVVSTTDTTYFDTYWSIYGVSKKKPIVKLKPYRI